MLLMVLCEEDGVVYNVWITSGSVCEVKAFRTRKERSRLFKCLVKVFEVCGNKGYSKCDEVVVCKGKESKAGRQVVEAVIGQIKGFNHGIRWRKSICVLVYLMAYAIFGLHVNFTQTV